MLKIISGGELIKVNTNTIDFLHEETLYEQNSNSSWTIIQYSKTCLGATIWC